MRLNHILIVFLLLTGFAAAQVVVTSSGYATFGGPAIVPALPSVPIAQPGVITFVNASNAPVGATNATGQNIAGATNATIMNVPATSAASTVMSVYTAPVTAVESPLASSAEREVRPPRLFEMAAAHCPEREGVAYTESAYNTAASPAWMPSLADAARAARQSRTQAGNIPVYTNADLQRLRESPAGAISIMGPAPEGTVTAPPGPPPAVTPTTPPPVRWRPAPKRPQ